MVSIDSTSNFPGKLSREGTGNKEESSALDDLFASIFCINETDDVNFDPSLIPLSGGIPVTSLTTTDLFSNDLETNSKNILLSKGLATGNPKIFELFQAYKNALNLTDEIKDGHSIRFNISLETLIKNIETVLAKTELQTPISAKDLSLFSQDTFPAPQNNSETGSKILSEKLDFEKFSRAQLEKILMQTKSRTQLISDAANNRKQTDSTLDPAEDILPLFATANGNKNKGNTTIGNRVNGNFEIRATAGDHLRLDLQSINQSALSDKLGNSFGQATGNKDSFLGKSGETNPSTLGSSSTLETQLKMLEKNWGSNLAKIIERAILSGKDKINITLDPQKLGKLQLNLSINNNNASIIVNTENTATALLLNGAEDRLSQLFEASGLKLSNFHANANGKQSHREKDETSERNIEKSITEKEEKLNDNESLATSTDNSKLVNLIA